MNRKHILKEFSEVFSIEFLAYMDSRYQSGKLDKNDMQQFMNRVEEFEEKESLELVSVFESYIIFRKAS